LEFGIWNLVFGIWNLVFGIWNLEFGIFDFMEPMIASLPTYGTPHWPPIIRGGILVQQFHLFVGPRSYWRFESLKVGAQ
jgi:hypothetical protein